MKRRTFLKRTAAATGALFSIPICAVPRADAAEPGSDWLAGWEKNILGNARSRYCDKEMGEELGWLVSPFLNGFYYGHRATRDTVWVERLVEWTDACLKRAVTEPDGFPGWPKGDGGGGDSAEYSADSLLGEAMMLRPITLMAGEILRMPTLASKWGVKASEYLALAGRIFEKWDSRGCWRAVGDGGVWVVPGFGIDRKSGGWSAGYGRRMSAGFSNPANKQNHIARWLLALHDVTKKPLYRERAERWFRVMKSRMKTRDDGRYSVWNYWDPAGPWDYKSNGAPKHWVGVHPNGGYYQIDVEAIVDAFGHGLVFTREDIDRLIATNRDFMWNQRMEGARFQRIDGGETDPRWKNSPGVLWTALVPYDDVLRKIFLANHNPSGWGGIAGTPWFLQLDRK
jgi:hypothetical protein